MPIFKARFLRSIAKLTFKLKPLFQGILSIVAGISIPSAGFVLAYPQGTFGLTTCGNPVILIAFSCCVANFCSAILHPPKLSAETS